MNFTLNIMNQLQNTQCAIEVVLMFLMHTKIRFHVFLSTTVFPSGKEKEKSEREKRTHCGVSACGTFDEREREREKERKNGLQSLEGLRGVRISRARTCFYAQSCVLNIVFSCERVNFSD